MGVKCNKCGAINDDNAIFCSKCKAALSDGTTELVNYNGGLSTSNSQKKMVDFSSKILVTVIVAIVIAIIVLLCIFLFNGNSANTSQGQADTDEMQNLSAQLSDETNSQIDGLNDLQAQDFGDDYVEISDIQLDYDSCEIVKGDTVTITATVSPDNATVHTVYWYSENDDVATVDDNGNVEAKGEGFVNIYATDYTGNVAAYCEVRVIDDETLVVPDYIGDCGTYYVDADELTLRYGPGDFYAGITTIQYDELVNVKSYAYDSDGNEWAYIGYDVYDGWVYSGFLTELVD